MILACPGGRSRHTAPQPSMENRSRPFENVVILCKAAVVRKWQLRIFSTRSSSFFESSSCASFLSVHFLTRQVIRSSYIGSSPSPSPSPSPRQQPELRCLAYGSPRTYNIFTRYCHSRLFSCLLFITQYSSLHHHSRTHHLILFPRHHYVYYATALLQQSTNQRFRLAGRPIRIHGARVRLWRRHQASQPLHPKRCLPRSHPRALRQELY